MPFESASASTSTLAHDLADRFRGRTATVGVIGLGYVGLPLVRAMTDAGFTVYGFDIDQQKVDMLERGATYIRHLPGEHFAGLIADGKFIATADFGRTAEADALLICVPTPLTHHREPDLSYVETTVRAIVPHLRRGQLVVLESTTYPGTSRELMKPLLEATGLLSGRDFYMAYSPEREDPGNAQFTTTAIPKVVGGDGPDAVMVACALYDQFVSSTVPVSNLDTAEAVKITENIFRAVNIALVNELKTIYSAMDIDVWEVIEAAKTKPFGYMAFYPGPGLGGHCIPIDPFYLTWRAREHEITTRFIELAGEINTAMPGVVVDRVAAELNLRFARSLNGARVLLLGLAYKKNVDDIRESPAFKLIDLLEKAGAEVNFHDPYVAEIPAMREHAQFSGRSGVALTPDVIQAHDLCLICTDHDGVDYGVVADHAPLVVDTRNVMDRSGFGGRPNLCKA